MGLAKTLRKPPRDIAASLVSALQREAGRAALGRGAGDRRARASSTCASKPQARQRIVSEVLQAGERFGHRRAHGGRVMVEFVSANPTGPLHVGHGRNAALGDTRVQPAGHAGLVGDARVLLQRRRRADRDARHVGAGAAAGPEAGRCALARGGLQRRVHRRHRRRLPGQARPCAPTTARSPPAATSTTSTPSRASRWPTCATSRTWTCARSACTSTPTTSNRACTPTGVSSARCSSWSPPARPTSATARCG